MAIWMYKLQKDPVGGTSETGGEQMGDLLDRNGSG